MTDYKEVRRKQRQLPAAPKTYTEQRIEQRRRMGLPVPSEAAAVRCDSSQFTLSHDAFAKAQA